MTVHSATTTSVHGDRVERHNLFASKALAEGSGWPHLAQALQLVRTVTFGEDKSQNPTGAVPQIMIPITLLRRASWTNLAQALRANAAQPRRLIPLLMTTGK